MVRTTVELDEKLLNEAMKLTGKTTKKEVVNYALEELVKTAKRRRMLELEGKVTGRVISTKCGKAVE